jgi:hypothetical protein
MLLPKPKIWVVYISDFIEDLELFKDLVKAIYNYSKDDITTIRILDPLTDEEYDFLQFIYNVVPRPNIYAVDAHAIPEYLESDIVLRNRVHLAIDFNICLKYKGAIVYCNEMIGTGSKPTSSLTYPFFTASEEYVIYRGYGFKANGKLLYLTELGNAYWAAVNNDRLVMKITVCNRDNPTSCNSIEKNIFINEHRNFESEVFTFDRDVFLFEARVTAANVYYEISRLWFDDEPRNLKPVNLGGGYSNVIEKNERYTVEVPAPRIKLIEIKDYLRMFRRL